MNDKKQELEAELDRLYAWLHDEDENQGPHSWAEYCLKFDRTKEINQILLTLA